MTSPEISEMGTTIYNEGYMVLKQAPEDYMKRIDDSGNDLHALLSNCYIQFVLKLCVSEETSS